MLPVPPTVSVAVAQRPLPVEPQSSQAGVLLTRPLRTDATQLVCLGVKDGACGWAAQEVLCVHV